ncbi:MAG: hypothetical protein AAF957_11640 [Planctomycetota bacterium]
MIRSLESLGLPRRAPLALISAVSCAALAVAIGADVAAAWRAPLALVVVLGGSLALGPLLLATPVEPSPLKLVLLSALLSPPLAAACWLALVFWAGAPPRAAWVSVFALAAVAAVACVRKRVGAEPMGRAAWVAFAAGVLLAILAFAATRTPGDLETRLSSSACVAHATIAEALGRGAPLAHPWLFGGELEVRPATGAFLAAVAEPAGIAPLHALAFVRAWAVLATVLVGYLAAAAAFREVRIPGAGRRDVLAGLLAAASAGIVPSALAVAGGRAPASPWIEADPSSLLARLYAFAALLAGLHAVRRGARPWPGLTALLVAVAALLQPWTGAAIAAALLVAASFARRGTMQGLLVLALLPAFVVGRLFGGFSGDQVASGGATAPPLPPWLALALVAAPVALLALRADARPADGADRDVLRRGLIALALAIVAPAVLATLPTPARGDAAALLAAGLLPASVAAAAGLVSLRRPLVGVTLAFALFGLSALGAARLALADRASAPPPLRDDAFGLLLTGPVGLANGLGGAFAWIRSSELARRSDVALLRASGGGESDDGRPSLTPLLTGVPLWADTAEPPGMRQDRSGASPPPEPGWTRLGDRWADRKELLSALFLEQRAWQHRFDMILQRAVSRGTTLVVVATEADRRRTTDRGAGPRGTDTIVIRLGGRPVWQSDQVAVYVIEPEAR